MKINKIAMQSNTKFHLIFQPQKEESLADFGQMLETDNIDLATKLQKLCGCIDTGFKRRGEQTPGGKVTDKENVSQNRTIAK